MFTPLYTAAAIVLPLADPEPGANLNTTGIVGFVVSKILPIILAFVGVMIVISARRQKMSDVFDIVMKVVIGVAIIGSGTLLYAFGNSLVKVFIS